MPSQNTKLSILMPSIPSRIEKYMLPLFRKLEQQAAEKPVEILCHIDNKMRSIGLKRDSLLQSARGQYLAFVDDDDEISDDYVDSLLLAANEMSGVDVIVFKQWVTINGGNKFTVNFGMEYENEEVKQIDGVWQDVKRKPFHICAWRSDIAQKERFPDASYGEDWHWSERVLKEVTTQARIDKHLHFYRYSDKVTEAELDFAK